MKNIILISIGDELLNGDTLDTNSQWISEKLNAFPVKIHRKYTILDEKEALVEILSQYVGKMDLILMTGGLGPTEDDMTQGILAEFFNSKIVKNEEIYEKLKSYFIKRKGSYEEHNLDQAFVPEKAKIIPNDLGTASGTWFEEKGTIVVSLPGVPFEMKDMMKKTVLPDLSDLWKTDEVKYTKHVWIAGIGESDLAKKIADWEKNLDEKIKLAYLPKTGMIKLRMECFAANIKEGKSIIEGAFDAIRDEIKEFIISENNTSLLEAVINLIRKHKKSIGTVESCTGGYFSNTFTNIEGISEWYNGSLITYNYQAKENIAKVNKTDLEKYGAVSQEVVYQMVKNGQKILNVDICIAVSGLLGPDSGGEKQEVGTVFVGIAIEDKIQVHKLKVPYDRLTNKTLVFNRTMHLLYKELSSNHGK